MKEAKPLEGKLKEFMDSATEGAVLVSFGSALKPEQMPPEKIQVFIDTFKNLGMKVMVSPDIVTWDTSGCVEVEFRDARLTRQYLPQVI